MRVFFYKFCHYAAGYGFVDFESPMAAEGAVKALVAKGIQAQMAKVGIWLLRRLDSVRGCACKYRVKTKVTVNPSFSFSLYFYLYFSLPLPPPLPPFYIYLCVSSLSIVCLFILIIFHTPVRLLRCVTFVSLSSPPLVAIIHSRVLVDTPILKYHILGPFTLLTRVNANRHISLLDVNFKNF